MEIRIIEQYGTWASVKRAALKTVGLKPITKMPTEEWKRKIILSEESPLRLLAFLIEINDIKNFVINHLARHNIGVEKFVKTLRNDLTGTQGVEITRETLNSFEFYVNSAALINISRKRLCNKAHKETRIVWQAVVDEIVKLHPAFDGLLVRECVYRSSCPFLRDSCNYTKTANFNNEYQKYWNI